MTQPVPDSSNWREDLGFGQVLDIRGRSSIADLFGHSKSRTGIYLLGYLDGTYYIGQARDVVRRFGGHRRNSDDIESFSFMKTSRSGLDELERDTIHKAETLGVPLRNRIHVADIIGSVDLDELIPKKSQDHWLENPFQKIRNAAAAVIFPPDSPQRIRTNSQFRILSEHPRFPSIRRIFSSFVKNCIPVPATTQLTYWSLSALPSTNKSHHPRFSCLNVNWMEMLVCGWIPRAPVSCWAFINVAKSALGNSFRFNSELKQTFPGVILCRASYRSAGGNAIHLEMNDLDEFEHLINDPRIQEAARVLALQLMRKGPTVFGKVHCPEFADVVLSNEK